MTVPLLAGAGSRRERGAPMRDGTVMVVCAESEPAGHLGSWLNASGWRTSCAPSVEVARENLRLNGPDAIVVSGDFEREAVAALREVRPVDVIWMGRDGPDTPRRAGDGVLDISAFSHRALLDAVDRAAGFDVAPRDTAPAPRSP